MANEQAIANIIRGSDRQYAGGQPQQPGQMVPQGMPPQGMPPQGMPQGMPQQQAPAPNALMQQQIAALRGGGPGMV